MTEEFKTDMEALDKLIVDASGVGGAPVQNALVRLAGFVVNYKSLATQLMLAIKDLKHTFDGVTGAAAADQFRLGQGLWSAGFAHALYAGHLHAAQFLPHYEFLRMLKGVADTKKPDGVTPITDPEFVTLLRENLKNLDFDHPLATLKQKMLEVGGKTYALFLQFRQIEDSVNVLKSTLQLIVSDNAVRQTVKAETLEAAEAIIAKINDKSIGGGGGNEGYWPSSYVSSSSSSSSSSTYP